tara:strand:+ start:3029 stop:3769 length:741 start_codon:yes stop_codon:yes gene_type:complete
MKQSVGTPVTEKDTKPCSQCGADMDSGAVTCPVCERTQVGEVQCPSCGLFVRTLLSGSPPCPCGQRIPLDLSPKAVRQASSREAARAEKAGTTAPPPARREELFERAQAALQGELSGEAALQLQELLGPGEEALCVARSEPARARSQLALTRQNVYLFTAIGSMGGRASGAKLTLESPSGRYAVRVIPLGEIRGCDIQPPSAASFGHLQLLTAAGPDEGAKLYLEGPLAYPTAALLYRKIRELQQG